MRPLVALLVAALLAALVPAPAAAQSSSETGIVNVTVTDGARSTAAAPLADARVTLIGPTVASALTTRSGIVRYTDVPSGIYRVRIAKGGFQGSTSGAFEVLGNKQVDVDVALGRQQSAPGAATTSSTDASGSGLQVIGRVQARVTVNTRDVSDDSAVRRISDSLTDALGTLAGVSVNQDTNDPNAPQTVSLRGHDESQTAVTLDGIPLGAPGTATNLRAVNTDLFAGAGTDFRASAGALGGSVNFRTLQPTQTWQSRLSTSYGTYDRFTYQLGETGSFGKLGLAVLHTDRQGNNPLTFQNYTDASGLTYPHGGESANVGDFLKLRYPLGDRTTINLTGLQNHQSTAALCTQDVTLLPCGIGPGNVSFGAFRFGYATLQSLVGETTVGLSAYVNDNVSTTNDALRTIDLAPSPFVTTQSSLARGLAASLTATRGRHTLTLNGSTYAGQTVFTPQIGASRFVTASTVGTASRQVALADSFKANDRLTLGGNVSYASVSGTSSSLLGGVSFGWRPSAADQLSGSLGFGSAQSPPTLPRTLSDPRNARFNCYAGTAAVSGPGDVAGGQASQSYDLSWTHQGRIGSVSVDAYRQNQSGQLVTAQISAPSLGIGAGDPYLQQLQSLFTSPTVCGTAFGTLAPQNVYVSEPIGGTERVYQGVTITGRLALGRDATIIPSYETTSAAIVAADPRLTGLNSTVILGSQIAGRPLHRENVTLDLYHPPSATEAIANVQIVGVNNPQHLAPYATVSAGISHAFGPGKITLFATNLFNTESGALSSLAFAEPIPLSGGGVLLTAANPLPQRQFTLTYSFNSGARPGAGYARPAPGASPAAAAGANPLRGRFQFTPPPPGTDPLAVDASRASCPADARPKASAVLDALRADAAAYPAGGKLADVAGFPVVGRGDPHGAWFLELQQPRFGGGPGGASGGAAPAYQQRVRIGPGEGGAPGGPGPGGPPPEGGAAGSTAPNPRPSLSPELRARFETFRAFVGCAYVTVLSSAEAKAKGIDLGHPGFGYAPSVGLYIERPPELGTGGGSVKKEP